MTIAEEVDVVFHLKQATEARWIEVNPILGPGEPGIEIDTDRFKIGDGVNFWADLDYYIPRDAVAALIQTAIDAIPPGSGDGVVVSLVEGSNITIDSTDPAHPVISSTATGTGIVVSLVEGENVTIDSTDPAHPVISAIGGAGGGGGTTYTLPTVVASVSGYSGVSNVVNLTVPPEVVEGDLLIGFQSGSWAFSDITGGGVNPAGDLIGSGWSNLAAVSGSYVGGGGACAVAKAGSAGSSVRFAMTGSDMVATLIVVRGWGSITSWNGRQDGSAFGRNLTSGPLPHCADEGILVMSYFGTRGAGVTYTSELAHVLEARSADASQSCATFYGELGPGHVDARAYASTYANFTSSALTIRGLGSPGSGGGGGGTTDARIGDMTDLSTEDQSSVVGAINEVNEPPVAFTLLYDNAKAG